MHTGRAVLVFLSGLLLASLLWSSEAGPSDASLSRRQGGLHLKLDSQSAIWIHGDAAPSASAEAQAGWATIVSEGFEGSFPGPWGVGDDKPGYGEYYWAKRNCRAYSGVYSGWAVGGGGDGSGLACGAYYPNDAESWMVYGPFSLADATAAELTFRLWLDSEIGYDYLWYMASLDGSSFSGSGESGESEGWEAVRFDLSNVYELGDVTGEPQVWIALIFETDSSINGPDGAYVDDILLRKYVGLRETDTPTPTNTPTPTRTRTSTPSRTLPAVSRRAVLPLITRSDFAYWCDPYEPNDHNWQAYGPLALGQTYVAYLCENDLADWYYFDLYASSRIAVDLAVPATVDYDLYLYAEGDWENWVARSASYGDGRSERIELDLQAGRFYLRVHPFRGHSNGQAYSLMVRHG